jgi:hypothetical protein
MSHSLEDGPRQLVYEKPAAVKTYAGSAVERAEQDHDAYPYVGQGDGKLVESGKLYSSGFSQCSAFVFENPQTKLGGLFHVADLDFEIPHQKLLKQFFLTWLNTVKVEPEERKKLAQAISDVSFYKYPASMRREDIAPALQKLGIGSTKAHLFGGDSGRYYIDSRLRKSLLEFLGVALPPTTVFNNHRRHWSILADFDAHKVEIGVPFANEAREYKI